MAKIREFNGLKKQIKKETGVEIPVSELRAMKLHARGMADTLHLSDGSSWQMNNGFLADMHSTFTSVKQLIEWNKPLAQRISRKTE